MSRSGYYPTVTTAPSVSQGDRGGWEAEGRRRHFRFRSARHGCRICGTACGLSIQNANAAAQFSAANLENLRLSLQATLALDYFTLLSDDSELNLLNENIGIYENYLKLTNDRFTGGGGIEDRRAAGADAALHDTGAGDRCGCQPASSWSMRIAVLVGLPPAGFHIPPGKMITEPPTVPTGVPSMLLERRPDVAGGAKGVAMASNVQIGIAKTAFFPTLTLSGQGRAEQRESVESADVGEPGVDGGDRRWRRRCSMRGRRHIVVRQAQDGRMTRSAATYQQTVLTAMQQVGR